MLCVSRSSVIPLLVPPAIATNEHTQTQTCKCNTQTHCCTSAHCISTHTLIPSIDIIGDTHLLHVSAAELHLIHAL